MSEAMKRLDEPGAWLCHYTRAETAFAHILPGGNLLMNSYAKMRDPFENKRPMFRSAGSYGDKSDDELRLFWMLQAEVGRSRDAWSLLSLTQGNDRESHRAITPFYRNPWSRPRMWEQYAENHAGACLIFAREVLIEALRRNLAAKGRYYEGEVSYTPTGFADSAAGAILLDQFHEHSLKDDVAHHVVNHYRDFFFLKAEDWATEFEYRFVFKRASDVALANFVAWHHVSYDRALRYVVVGEKFPEWQLPGAQAVARAAGVELRKMMWEGGLPYPAVVKPGRRRGAGASST